MPKAIQRLTKKAILAEVQTLRDKIGLYALMTDQEIHDEYIRAFPASSFQPDELKDQSRATMTRSLTIAATYYLTNVLNLE